MVLTASLAAALLSAQPALHVREDATPLLVRHQPTLRRRNGVWYRVRKSRPARIAQAPVEHAAPEPAPAVNLPAFAMPIPVEPKMVRTIPIRPQHTFDQRWGDFPR